MPPTFISQTRRNTQHISGGKNAINSQPRLAFTIFNYHKNWGKLAVTEGKPNDYHLPIGKKSVYHLGFLAVKLNFQF